MLVLFESLFTGVSFEHTPSRKLTLIEKQNATGYRYCQG
ncbi:hypothetical protein VCRA2119O147_640019 [Vibrio crassostreae]|nr:hypothetical protein VCRA2116O28_100081 [Vibrio crassostreae]CAK1699546.1 hypothetical protein VCRA2116O27_100081 [Vibrio crassostreae]CAK1717502.1 hypothetical protein VCRA2119O46_110078 [Vibrio crassostreae]CAK1718073.1 hypothetical protein VCRA2117O38_110080 [Vibrio crassostreae]CAK1735623.1 hypothetical protein VCRA2119O47_120079 [Vibrio crassostreae]